MIACFPAFLKTRFGSKSHIPAFAPRPQKPVAKQNVNDNRVRNPLRLLQGFSEFYSLQAWKPAYH